MSNREERFDVISIFAEKRRGTLDLERLTSEELMRYIQTRDYKRFEQFLKPGAKPTIYSVREIPHRVYRKYVCNALPPKDLDDRWSTDGLAMAFMAGVTRIQNLYNRDGVYQEEPYEPAHDDSGVLREEVLDRVPPEAWEEVGRVCAELCFYQGQIGSDLRLARTSLGRWAELELSLAVASQSSAARNSESQSSDSGSRPFSQETTCSEKPSDASDSGSATAVTAAGTPTSERAA